jgi:hypothetical protein
MKAMCRVLLATTSVVALTVAAQAQTAQINQTVTGANTLTSGNTSTLINSSGFGAVTLQAFQAATNSVNLGAATYTAATTPNSVTQSIASGGSLTVTTNNTNAGFSQNGAQLIQGSQGILSNINSAGLTLGAAGAASLQQNNVGGITSSQNNAISAGYNTPSGSSFGVGQGPSVIQGQTRSTSGTVTNSGNQSNAFQLNTGFITVSSLSATLSAVQSPGAINSTQTNFADAGQASPTSIDPSITGLPQTATVFVNLISSVAGATGTTLILEGASSTSKQSVGTASLDSFTVQNTARALTWNATSGSTGSGAYGSASGGTGDVSIQTSNQTVRLNFNAIDAGLTGPSQNVNFGGSSSFEQTVTYGSTTSTASGVTIANKPTGGYANFGVVTGAADNPVNVSFAATGSGVAVVSDVAQTADAKLNSAEVAGIVNGALTQVASINTATGTGTGTSGAAQGNGPQLSNFSGAVVQGTGPASLSNVDQTSTVASNSLTATGVGATGLTLNQTGYQTKSSNFSTSAQANPGLSSNVVIAGVLSSSTLGSNASISGSEQRLTNSQNTFSADTSVAGTSSPLSITQSLTPSTVGTATQEQAYGGDNVASARSLGASSGNGSLSNGSQLGSVNLNSATVATANVNTRTTIAQTASSTATAPLNVDGTNTGVAAGQTASITGYTQRYDVALNSVSLGGTGEKSVTQTSGAATINTGNTLSVTESGTSPFGSATIGGTTAVSQTLTASANKADLIGIAGGSLVQTAGPITSTLNNSATATATTSAGSSITGIIQTTTQSINTGL